MDKLRVHKTKMVLRYYRQLHVYPIFNVAYSPEFQPIEAIFSQVKQYYKKTRLNKLVNEEPFDTDAVIV